MMCGYADVQLTIIYESLVSRSRAKADELLQSNWKI